MAAFGLIVGIWLCGTGVVEGAYVIKLKNGNEYVTGRYWQEGGQVLFDTYGGIFGIEKSFIAKIESTDSSRLRKIVDSDPGEKIEAQTAKQDKDAAEAKTAGEIKGERKKDADDPITGEFNRLKEQSKQVNSLLTSEIRELLDQITAFKNKIARDSKLFIDYGREYNELHEIGAAVESALQSRTQ
jgi:hypothetical protein